jgi:hypothetical protein
VNQLSQLREDGVLVLEVPLRVEGRLAHIPLRIRREPEKPGSPEPGPRFSVTLDADLSRIGFVRARLDAAGRPSGCGSASASGASGHTSKRERTGWPVP